MLIECTFVGMTHTLGTRLLLCRRDYKWTQDELAARSGISRSYIAQLERGTVTNAGIEPLMALAKALEVSVAYLIGETEVAAEEFVLREGRAVYVVEDEEERQMTQELLRLFQKLNGADQRFALGMMRRIGGADVARVIGDE